MRVLRERGLVESIHGRATLASALMPACARPGPEALDRNPLLEDNAVRHESEGLDGPISAGMRASMSACLIIYT
jgi:hypothetical protein